jgi:glycosyltransferase involved in cell wall biosynthesis
MKIAYVASGLNMTFVVNEMESHRLAGWDILPIASCKPHSCASMSELMTQWCRRGLFRPSCFTQLLAAAYQVIVSPVRFVKAVGFLFMQLREDFVEFLKAFYEFPAACYFALACRKAGIEHVHVHFASRSLSLGLLIGILNGKPVSCTVHAFDIFTRSRGALRMRLLRCRFIAAVSRFNIEFLERLCGRDVAELCSVVHCGINLAKFSSIKRGPIAGNMICVAKLVEKKGYDTAIRACAVLNKKGIDFKYRIVGDGSLGPHLKALVTQLGLNGRVEFLGRRPNDKLLTLFGEACLFLMPCKTAESGDMDGIPVAMMEAMACGVPVVSTRISGIPELVKDGETGLLVGENDIESLALALEKILHNTALFETYGRAARRRIEAEFNINITANQLRELIKASHS